MQNRIVEFSGILIRGGDYTWAECDLRCVVQFKVWAHSRNNIHFGDKLRVSGGNSNSCFWFVLSVGDLPVFFGVYTAGRWTVCCISI